MRICTYFTIYESREGIKFNFFLILRCFFLSSFNFCDAQRDLVKCLEFGLVSKCAKICVTTLRICSLEMKELMMRMLPSVLLSLTKISATISMAIPVLAFLSSRLWDFTLAI